MNYAGFWMRFGAFIIDWIILGILNWLVIAPILAAIGITSGMSMSDIATGNYILKVQHGENVYSGKVLKQ